MELLTARNAGIKLVRIGPFSRHSKAVYIYPNPIVASNGLPVRRLETVESALLVRKNMSATAAATARHDLGPRWLNLSTKCQSYRLPI